MKKFIIGMVTGAMLATAGTTFAATGMIGKKVDSEATVKVNNSTVASAIIIQGKSYAPVRDITEALGVGVSYVKGVISIDTGSAEKQEKLYALTRQREVYVSERDSRIKANGLLEEDNIKQQKTIDSINQDWAKRPYQAQIETNNLGIAENKKKIAELQAKIDDIDKQIAQLEGA